VVSPYSTCESESSSVDQTIVAFVLVTLVACTSEICGGTVSDVVVGKCVMLSKLVAQPLVLAIVTLVQPPVQPVLIVVSWPAARDCVFVGSPAQLIDTEVELAPPLYASSFSSRRAVRNVNVVLVSDDVANEALFVENDPNGAECHHWAVPQSITFVGYWPFSGWFCPLLSSNVTTGFGSTLTVTPADGVSMLPLSSTARLLIVAGPATDGVQL
jgi:hypothetical protein